MCVRCVVIIMQEPMCRYYCTRAYGILRNYVVEPYTRHSEVATDRMGTCHETERYNMKQHEAKCCIYLWCSSHWDSKSH